MSDFENTDEHHGDIETLLNDLPLAKTAKALDEHTLRIVRAIGPAPEVGNAASLIANAISQRIMGIAEVNQLIHVPPALPRLLEILDQPLPDIAMFKIAERQLIKRKRKNLSRPSEFLEFHFNLLMLQSITIGLDGALAGFVRRLMAAPYKHWIDPKIEHLGQFFVYHHWFDGALLATVKAVQRAGALRVRPENVNKLMTLTRILGFIITAPSYWLDQMFEAVIVPGLLASTQLCLYDKALQFEWTAYSNYTRAKDNAEHFRDTVSRWSPHMRSAGKVFGTQLPALAIPSFKQDKPKIGFLLQNSRIMGHTEAFLSFLRGLDKLSSQPIRVVIYICGPKNAELDQTLSGYNVEFVYVNAAHGGNTPMCDDLMDIRTDIQSRGVTALVYVSLILTMPFAFAMPIAPVQIWWSMKYHSLNLPEIDGYLALGSFDDYRFIDGRSWRAVHRSMGNLFDPQLKGEAHAIRAKLLAEDKSILLGCIGREEKLISEDYIAALASILNSLKGAVFVWTGASENPQVIELFRRNGIGDRCRYIGWVNTKLYAQVLDVFVDSFPFASGLTAFEAMAAACPVVSMITRESLGTGMPGHIWPIYTGKAGKAATCRDVQALFTDTNGECLLPFTENLENYRAVVIRLANDAAYRTKVGTAMKEFVTRYMSDDRQMAESACRHILEVIDLSRVET